MTNPTIPFWDPSISDAFKDNERLKAKKEAERLYKKIKDHEEKLRKMKEEAEKSEEKKRKDEEDRAVKENKNKFKNSVAGMDV